jgi:protein-arginine kinase activator protein McsA
MHELTEKEYASFKAICAEKGIKYETEAEYKEAARNLLSYVKLTYDMAREHYGWEQRLRDEPKGFWLDSEGRTCYVCHTNVHGQIWFDKWGLKCANCHNAFEKKVFPGYILKDKDNNRHITDSQLNWKYGVHPQTIKKLIRMGLLVSRQIPNGPAIFLKKDNPDLPDVIRKYRKDKKI